MITVNCYGKMRRIFGDEIKVKENIRDIEELLCFLEKKNDEVKEIKEYLIFSINGKRASMKDEIRNGDKVAIFIPPTGG